MNVIETEKCFTEEMASYSYQKIVLDLKSWIISKKLTVDSTQFFSLISKTVRFFVRSLEIYLKKKSLLQMFMKYVHSITPITSTNSIVDQQPHYLYELLPFQRNFPLFNGFFLWVSGLLELVFFI